MIQRRMTKKNMTEQEKALAAMLEEARELRAVLEKASASIVVITDTITRILEDKPGAGDLPDGTSIQEHIEEYMSGEYPVLERAGGLSNDSC